MSEEKPKIIIDEDWKSQVEAEKQAAKQEVDQPSQASPTNQQGEALEDDPPMPPASFTMLISSLASEAMMALGQIPHPVTGEVFRRRNQAKYLIDTIEMLHEKTAGNVAAEETAGVQELLHSLKMAFVAMPKSSAASEPAQE